MNPTKARKGLFKDLKDILEVSQKKFLINNKPDKERRAWARVSITAIQAYGKLLETHQLDQLAKDIEEIKKEIRQKNVNS